MVSSSVLLMGNVSAFSINITTDGADASSLMKNFDKKLDEVAIKEKVVSSAEWFFWRIWWELITFVRNGMDDISRYHKSPELKEKIATLNPQEIVVSYAPLKMKNYFQDIENTTYADEINLIASCGVVNTSAKKFHPQNFVRLHELVKMLEKSYDYKNPDAPIIHFPKKKKTLLINTPDHYQLADEIGLLEWIENKEDFEHFVDGEEYFLIVKNFSEYEKSLLEKIEMKNWFSLLQNFRTKEQIKRGELARQLVLLFNLEQAKRQQSKRKLSDIEGNETVEILVAHNMYPFSDLQKGKVSRWGFAQFLAQVSSMKNNDNLASFSGKWEQKYSDVNYDQEGYMYYLDYKKYLDYLTEMRRGKNYFYPQREMTQYEAYYILEKFCDKWWEYDEKTADKALIDYNQLSELFVQCLSSSFQEKREKINKIEKDTQNENDILKTKWKAPVLSLWDWLLSFVD